MDKTFDAEFKLPDLPISTLENTISKYLDSVRAVASDEEFENTKKICEDFLDGEGVKLHEKLQEHAKTQRNWLEKWWLDKAYLELRFPLPYMNFAGCATYQDYFWPLKEGTQLTRMAFSLHIVATFWQLLRNQQLPPHKSGAGQTLSMDQLRTAFNTCRIPHRGMDELANHFKPRSDGYTPSHTVVICRGYFFKLNLINPKSEKPYTPPQIEKALQNIKDKCVARANAADGVAALTALDRDRWADIRNHLIDLSEINQKNLYEIESAIHVVSMDEEIVGQTDTDILRNGFSGNPTQRWRDKCFNEIWGANGSYSSSCEHSAMDGMVMVLFVEFTMSVLKPCNGVWMGSADCAEFPKPEELEFRLDEQVYDAIEEGKKVHQTFDEDLQLIVPSFTKFGKLELKKLKIVPDVFIQICIQLAYIRLHGKPAATYETATTRKYFHGRTETCRTCTPELEAFCEAAKSSDNNNDPVVIELLRAAHDKGLALMRASSDGKGCDRHLFALAIVAKEQGLSLPALFSDPMFEKSGGNGKFVLSTSFVGYFNCSGGVPPMVDNGYGIFYRVNDHKLPYVVTTWKHCDVTNNKLFAAELEKAFVDVFKMFESKSQL
uniref:peroxisomal carnitine O-octanoyltransferase-like n=1 Tax=Ciona intestinalis TaxID=7719 RepID=UPI000180B9BD|nr:peroxisomal carnitine O-octanoyltransferase-like [Ciona intestinalis]|eukprot:XP_002121792.1 peroxisomal carnitine O-octanoyltransferase-like [Ciona intestinalis]